MKYSIGDEILVGDGIRRNYFTIIGIYRNSWYLVLASTYNRVWLNNVKPLNLTTINSYDNREDLHQYIDKFILEVGNTWIIKKRCKDCFKNEK